MLNFSFVASNDFPEIQKDIHSFRRKIFIEREGYTNVQDIAGGEYDEFDHFESSHIICQNESEIVACARLNFTSRPHLLGKFPQITGQAYPKDQQTWDLSRFATDHTLPEVCTQAELLHAVLKKALDFGVNRIVAFCSDEYIDILSDMGLQDVCALRKNEAEVRYGSAAQKWNVIGLSFPVCDNQLSLIEEANNIRIIGWTSSLSVQALET